MSERKYLMSKTILLRIYKRMIRNPKKCFILKDFNLNSNTHRTYMDTLIRLGLIERCNVIYKAGRHYSMTKTTKGYKLKKL